MSNVISYLRVSTSDQTVQNQRQAIAAATDTPAGKLALTMFAAFAEFEHGIRKERQREGIARARAEGGKYLGRKPKLTDEQKTELVCRFNAGE